MKLKPQVETLSNLEVAHRQLERAISLYMQEQDYVSALTLAGAAEEILGKLLIQQGQSHWLESISVASLVFLGFPESEHASHEAKEAKREIANIANFHKNRLKHMNVAGEMTFAVNEKAAEMIDRAITNYFELTKRETGAMGRFLHEVLRRG